MAQTCTEIYCTEVQVLGAGNEVDEECERGAKLSQPPFRRLLDTAR
jgi:hypothetical protein